ncbi:nucleotidyltransferase family protein [Colwelliaceae bacterium BS250]
MSDKNINTTITKQTFIDLGMWLTHPEQHTAEQLKTLLDEDARLPLIKIINTYWLGGAFYHSLNINNVWQKLDEELQLYLTELEQFYVERNQGIKEEAIFACNLLQSANIPVVILKGGASLFNGVFNPISQRFMTDIDLLVPEELQDKANSILLAAGYAQQIEEHDHASVGHHHAPALFRENGKCCVELHRWVLKKSVSDVLSTEDVWQQATPLQLNDSLSVLQMEPNQQMVLSIAHSEISHNGFADKHIDWRQLLNAYAIAQYYEPQLNWLSINEHFARCNKTAPMQALLIAAYKYFKFNTAITLINDQQANAQIDECINLYVKRQSSANKYGHLVAVLKGYSKETIELNYGNKGSFPLLTGRFKHFKRHLYMLTTPKYLKRFLSKVK